MSTLARRESKKFGGLTLERFDLAYKRAELF